MIDKRSYSILCTILLVHSYTNPAVPYGNGKN